MNKRLVALLLSLSTYGQAWNFPEGNFYAGGDWLYWKTEEDKLEVAANVTIENFDTSSEVNSKVLTPEFKYDNGFRVFGGFQTSCEDWKLELSYVQLSSHPRKEVMNEPATMMRMDLVQIFNMNFPILSAISETPLSEISFDWHNQLKYLDIDLSRHFSFCEHFEIIPHLGIRNLWDPQKLTISGSTLAGLSFNSTLKETIYGIGVEGGLWGSFELIPGLSLKGHLGSSLCYTRFKNKGTLFALDPISPFTLDISYSDTSYRAIPSLDTFIGLEYFTSICETYVDFHVGWEQHLFFNLNQFSVDDGGNLTVNGLTLGGAVYF